MELILDYLESYEGRDKFIGTLSYATKFATILSTPNSIVNKNLILFGNQMSNCRVIFRFLDDIPTLHYAITYGWGRQEPDRVTRWLELLLRWIDVISSPVETICWAGEHKFIFINVDKWDNVSVWLWIISLNLTALKSLKKYFKLLHYKNKIVKRKCSNLMEKNSLNHQINNEIIICIRMILDLSYAISYLPKGTLWGGKLLTWQIGTLGLLSSSFGLYQALSRRLSYKNT